MSLTRISLLASLVAAALVAPLPPLSHASSGAPPAPGCGRSGEADPSWAPASTTFGEAEGYDPYVGNGYLGHRVPAAGAGYAATAQKTGWPLYTPRYDGAFVAGLFGREQDLAGGREVIAALPSWTTLEVGVGPETYGSGTPAGRVSRYRQTVHLRCGVVVTSLRWTTADGRATDLTYEVLADRSDVHAGAVRLRMTPHWSGTATVTGRLDKRGARRVTVADDGTFRTTGTGTEGAVVQAGSGEGTHTVRVTDGRAYTFEKYVGVDTALTSRDPLASARAAARRAERRGWSGVLADSAEAWRTDWASDIAVPGSADLTAWLRAARYGLLANTRTGSSDSLAPAGLTSDNYAGMVFWDAETWMYPGLLATRPELARSVVEYRYRTRHAARANAEQLGYKGLFFPWTSASRGRLDTECQSWDPPHCLTQNHLQGDVSLAVWQYYLATGDRDWLAGRGWPLLKGIADFWESRATAEADGGYSVRNVAGPDEYSNGVDDGVFTNAVAVLALRNATRAAQLLGESAPAGWTRVADGLRIPYDAERKLFLQYAGYDGSTIKQADTVLLTYPLEWPMEEGAAAATLDFYAARTDPDGPAMTDSVHAIDAAAIGEPGCSTYTYLQRSVRPFVRGPYHLFSEARGEKSGAQDPLSGFPAEDFLTGKGGFLQVFTHGLTGLRLREDGVRLDPSLPPQLREGVELTGLRYRGRTYDVSIGPRTTTVRLTDGEPFTVHTPAGPRRLAGTLTLPTRRPDLTPTSDAARCRPAAATSEAPGLYAAAAVDGSPATAWSPQGATGTLTVDLGRAVRVASVTPAWSDVAPASYTVETSPDGRTWRAFRAGDVARKVRMTVTSDDPEKPVGVTELAVGAEKP
ncbi:MULTISPECIES: discoidin domain-containing protein [unclassified Streptomyces]|uniref:discoidin domain-containing protein n=1 Tax=unclassified Streptomyces TaxID=2593676 RepID=UPI0001C1CA8E|nr:MULTISPECIES: discoidin domain-containing protein [unclassified Streptomyces]MYR68135.1 haloacid dehalogenase [Streptomyces sp. SID4939]MYR99864.1 haloacid dehalogenase [Streptomyces sp. SID4940]MYT63303.1 haloacid dehalogenase [Streptomyces sp. SID8357]MYT88421.1 haloacid dehalogenase [Streptomyces sp. SID8360]MYW39611.1 haloacid dehalogenase [Streptomyces sp. SID1]